MIHLLSTNDFHEMFSDGGPINTLGYADDTCLYIIGNDLPAMQREMQEALHKCERWAEGLSLRETLQQRGIKNLEVPFCNQYPIHKL